LCRDMRRGLSQKGKNRQRELLSYLRIPLHTMVQKTEKSEEGFMFIYSVRASTLKFFCAVGLAVLTLAVLIVFVPSYGAATGALAGQTVDWSGVRTNEDRVALLKSFGYEVEQEPLETEEFALPEEFDRVLTGYNELQKSQGLDLTRYAKKRVTRYTYTVTNYKDFEGTVYANLILYRDRIVAADICSADPAGFVHTLVPETE